MQGLEKWNDCSPNASFQQHLLFTALSSPPLFPLMANAHSPTHTLTPHSLTYTLTYTSTLIPYTLTPIFECVIYTLIPTFALTATLSHTHTDTHTLSHNTFTQTHTYTIPKHWEGCFLAHNGHDSGSLQLSFLIHTALVWRC